MVSICQRLHFMANPPCLTSSGPRESDSAAGLLCGIIPRPALTRKRPGCFEE
jgi:hypothetical protein